MTTVSFNSQHSYTGHSIMVDVRLLDSALPYTIQAVLDTGAVISTFDEQIAATIRISDVTTGTPRDYFAADGQKATGYIHVVRVEVWGKTLPIPVAFVPGWKANLLGMQGFLEQLIFGLDHARRAYYVR